MTAKNVVLLAVAVVALGAAGYLVMNRESGGPALESMNREMFFTCRSADCKAEFSMTKRQYVNARGTESVPPCPECGKRTTALAEQCPECKRNVELVGHAALPPNCPHCDYSFGNYKEQYQKEKEFHDKVASGEISPDG